MLGKHKAQAAKKAAAAAAAPMAAAIRIVELQALN